MLEIPPALRALDQVSDLDAVARLDRTYITEQVYTVRWEADQVAMVPSRLPAPEIHTFPFDPSSEPWDEGVVVAAGGALVGVCAVTYHDWNRRLAIIHYYVDRAHRGRGVGRTLMEWAVGRGTALGARTVWAETANTNHPGIHAYLRMGFQVCGFDVSHYVGTSAEGTFAVFLGRTIPRDADPT